MTYAENIVACYERATGAERDAGMSWYSDAHTFALSLDPDNVWRAAGVISALSPRKEWGLNMRLALRAYETGIVTGNTGAQNDKAQRILDGAHENVSDILAILGGDKTQHFAASIATNGIHDIAVIDRHAYDVATATVHTDKTRPNIGKRVYRVMAEHYRQAALECDISVAQMQAVTWVRWKNEKGVR